MTPSEKKSDPLWLDGWYKYSRQRCSPNQGPRPIGAKPELIVLHSISLPPGEYGGDQVQRLFNNQLDWNEHPYFKTILGMQVSSHFYIQRQGELWQFVSCDQRAWHAGVSNYLGRSNCNDHSIGIELEGLEGDFFEGSQYDTLTSLCAAIMQHYPATHIAGHEHIAPGRKFDPGAGFKWHALQDALALPADRFPSGTLSPNDA